MSLLRLARKRWSRGAPVAGATILLSLALAGCGIPVNGTARTITSLPAISPPPTTNGVGSYVATIYYMKAGRVFPVQRNVTSLDPSTLLTLLIQEPLTTEVGKGISNVLSPNSPLGLGNPPVNGVITVVLPSKEFFALSGSFLYDAYAEIVYTLTDPANTKSGDPIHGVSFQMLLNGVPQPWYAYLPGFTVSQSSMVTRADYAAIAPIKASASG